MLSFSLRWTTIFSSLSLLLYHHSCFPWLRSFPLTALVIILNLNILFIFLYILHMCTFFYFKIYHSQFIWRKVDEIVTNVDPYPAMNGVQRDRKYHIKWFENTILFDSFKLLICLYLKCWKNYFESFKNKALEWNFKKNEEIE